jgi:multisubunit Na+/H+ antiporter MnhG subunit
MKPNVRMVVLSISTTFGIILLAFGALASFSIGANDTITSIVGFLLIFFLPIASCVIANWHPKIAGVAVEQQRGERRHAQADLIGALRESVRAGAHGQAAGLNAGRAQRDGIMRVEFLWERRLIFGPGGVVA